MPAEPAEEGADSKWRRAVCRERGTMSNRRSGAVGGRARAPGAVRRGRGGRAKGPRFPAGARRPSLPLGPFPNRAASSPAPPPPGTHPAPSHAVAPLPSHRRRAAAGDLPRLPECTHRGSTPPRPPPRSLPSLPAPGLAPRPGRARRSRLSPPALAGLPPPPPPPGSAVPASVVVVSMSLSAPRTACRRLYPGLPSLPVRER